MNKSLSGAVRRTARGLEHAPLTSPRQAALVCVAALFLAACGDATEAAAPTVTVTASPSVASTITVTATPTSTPTLTSSSTPTPTKASPTKAAAARTCSQYAGDGSDAYSLSYPDNIKAYWCGDIASGRLTASVERDRKLWVAYPDRDYTSVAKAKCAGEQDSGWTRTVANRLGVDRSFVITASAWVWDCGPYR